MISVSPPLPGGAANTHRGPAGVTVSNSAVFSGEGGKARLCAEGEIPPVEKKALNDSGLYRVGP